jgi:hypothetical protein
MHLFGLNSWDWGVSPDDCVSASRQIPLINNNLLLCLSNHILQ